MLQHDGKEISAASGNARWDLSGLILVQNVADPRSSDDVARVARVGLNFAAQASNIDPQEVRFIFVLRPPNLRQQIGLRDDTSSTFRKLRNYAKFSRRQIRGFIADKCELLSEVNGELTCLEGRLPLVNSVELGSTKNCSHPSHELIFAKWLRQVIIGASVKAPHLVLLVVASRNDDNRYSRKFSDSTRDFKSINTGDSQVHQQQVELLRFARRQGGQAVHGRNGAIPIQLEIALNEAKKAWVVIYDKYGGSLGIHQSFP
jgi:hypothetical protein